MKTAVEIVGYVNLALYVLAGGAAMRVSRRTGSRAGAWAAATFGSLALVVVVARLLPQDPHGAEAVVLRLLVALLVVFPYLLYRFTTTFERASPRLERLVAVPTLLMIAWT